MKILVLENRDIKAQQITSVLQKFHHEVTVKFCVKDIKQEIENCKYDILVLDLKVPMVNADNHKEKEDIKNGLTLIQSIFDGVRTTRYRFKGVVVLSEYVDDKIYEALAIYPLIIIPFDNMEKWKGILSKKIDYYGNLQQDIAIITAVEVEENAFKKWGWESGKKVKDLVYSTKVLKIEKREIRLVFARQEQMGMVTATNLTSKIINYFEPRCIIMAGICAGRKGGAKLGDIVFAKKAWDYGSGSVERKKGHSARKDNIKFIPAPDYIDVSDDIATVFRRYHNDGVMKELKEKIYKEAKESEDLDLQELTQEQMAVANTIHVGAMASGAAVIKSEQFTDQFVRRQNKKYAGLDMETYGVYYAAKHSSQHPEFFCVKCVSDVADENKGDKFQIYCAELAAKMVEYYIHNSF